MTSTCPDAAARWRGVAPGCLGPRDCPSTSAPSSSSACTCSGTRTDEQGTLLTATSQPACWPDNMQRMTRRVDGSSCQSRKKPACRPPCLRSLPQHPPGESRPASVDKRKEGGTCFREPVWQATCSGVQPRSSRPVPSTDWHLFRNLILPLPRRLPLETSSDSALLSASGLRSASMDSEERLPTSVASRHTASCCQ